MRNKGTEHERIQGNSYYRITNNKNICSRWIPFDYFIAYAPSFET